MQTSSSSIDPIFFAAQQQLYNYALNLCLNDTYLFPSRFFQQPKPSYSYIGLIAMAILSSPERQLVLSDIYQWILHHYPYFRTRSSGWRNSIRHNLSLNDCFIKASRSSNGKGHYWSIHPANLADFLSGDFRRRRAQRRVRNSLELSTAGNDESDEIEEIPSNVTYSSTTDSTYRNYFHSDSKLKSRKRCFDVDSLLAPDQPSSHKRFQDELLSSPNSKSNSSTDTNLST